MINAGRALRRVIAVLEAELADAEQTKALLDQLRARADVELTKPNIVKRCRRRRRLGRPRKSLALYRRVKIKTRSKEVSKAPAQSRRDADNPSPAPAPATKAKRPARGVVEFAAELEQIAQIMQRVAAARDAIAAAKTAKDAAAAAKATDDLRQSMASGGAVLKTLGGCCRLPAALTKKERRRWRQAAENAAVQPKREARKAVPKAEETSAKAKDVAEAKAAKAPPTTNGAAKKSRGEPAPKYPKTILSAWHADENGVLTRVLQAEGEKPVLPGEGFQV